MAHRQPATTESVVTAAGVSLLPLIWILKEKGAHTKIQRHIGANHLAIPEKFFSFIAVTASISSDATVVGDEWCTVTFDFGESSAGSPVYLRLRSELGDALMVHW